jgi:hypothetical protein
MEIIQQIGSYAGLAAVVGLAVLAGLYFSQARDVKRLREWAGRAPERLPTPAPYQQQRVVAQPMRPPTPPPPPPGAQPTPPPPPGASPGAQPTPLPPAPPAPAQAAAAGAGPAVATGPLAATPAAARAAEGVESVTQNTVAHPPPRPPPQTLPPRSAPPGLGGHFAREAQIARAREEAERAAAEPDADQDERLEPGDEAPAEGQPPAAEAQDPDVGVREEAPVEDELDEMDHVEDHDADLDEEEHADAVYSEESDPDLGALPEPEDFHEGDALLDQDTGDQPAVAPPPPPAPITASRQPLPPRPAPPARAPQGPILPPYEQSRPGGSGSWETQRMSRPMAALAVGGTALVVGAAAFGVLQLAGDDDGSASSPTEEPQAKEDAPPKKTSAAPAVDPSKVTVSVLNGTTVGGLAAELGDKLEGQGYQLGNVTNNTDQQRAESVVLFAPGAEAEAKDVSKRLRINQREPIDPDSQTRAGDATVVVVAGADLSN